jgi:parallel beta helix pectate lyase-like protein
VTCTRYASPSGNDAASGSATTPFRTAQNLVSSLGAGQTGCLAAGATFTQNATVSRGGIPAGRVTLTTHAGGRPGDHPRAALRHGRGERRPHREPHPRRAQLERPAEPERQRRPRHLPGNEVTNLHTGICFTLGSLSGYGRAVGVVLDGNRIHDCGRLPSQNRDHGVSAENLLGGRITNNYIYDNADRGVQLYPNSQSNLVANNVIDGNGEGVIFSGDLGYASSGNTVRDNLITNSVIRYNVESYWPAGNPVGSGNVVDHNCVFGGRQGNIATQKGFTAVNTIVANAVYVNRAAKDFRLQAGSPCAGLGPPAAFATAKALVRR